MNLDDLMQFDHVIAVQDDGTVSETVHGVWAPECYVEVDGDGQVSKAAEHEMIASVYRQGWRPMFGYTAQYLSGDSPVMRASEFIGGRMEEDILSTPGMYVAVVVEILDSEDAYGWMICRKEDKE